MQDLSTKQTGDQLTAAEWDQLAAEVINAILHTGQTPTVSNLGQLEIALAAYATSGSFFQDGGTFNSYYLSAIGPRKNPAVYSDGTRARFIVANSNSGPSTVNIASLGTKTLTDSAGNPLVGGELVAGRIAEVRYDSNSDTFLLVNNDLPLVSVSEAVAGASVHPRSWSPSRFNQALIGLLPTVTQPEAEFGAATDRRAWTAERVRQAIYAALPTVTRAEAGDGTGTDPKAWTAELVKWAIQSNVSWTPPDPVGSGLSLSSPAKTAVTGIGFEDEVLVADAAAGTVQGYSWNKQTRVWATQGAPYAPTSITRPALAAQTPQQAAFYNEASNTLERINYNVGSVSLVGSYTLPATTQYVSLAALNDKDVAMLAFEPFGGGHVLALKTYRWDGPPGSEAWSLVGSQLGIISGTLTLGETGLTALSSTEVVIFETVTGGSGQAYHWDGSTWAAVGTGFSAAATATSDIALIALNDTDVLLFKQGSLSAHRFNGAGWGFVPTADWPLQTATLGVSACAMSGQDFVLIDSGNGNLFRYRMNFFMGNGFYRPY